LKLAPSLPDLEMDDIGAARRVTSAEIHRFIAAHTEAAS
jgi:hypothetical protein